MIKMKILAQLNFFISMTPGWKFQNGIKILMGGGESFCFNAKNKKERKSENGLYTALRKREVGTCPMS